MPEPAEPVDVLIVGVDTTFGWRRSRAELLRALGNVGVSATAVSASYGRSERLMNLTPVLTDLTQALALRRTAAVAWERLRPRAVVYLATTAALLQPPGRLGGHSAVWFDTPAALHRPGVRNLPQRVLERRSLARVGVLASMGLEVAEPVRAVLPGGGQLVALPLPIDFGPPGGHGAPRERLAVLYAANPHKKGLDLAIAGWSAAALRGWRLVVAGIDERQARRFLGERAVAVPDGVEWAGRLEPAPFRELLRRSEVFLSASRFENYGLAQLEALADGALLVSVGSAGPSVALGVARRLNGGLVSEDLSASGLADALRAAAVLDEQERVGYRERATELVSGYSRRTLEDRLERDLLPALLGNGGR